MIPARGLTHLALAVHDAERAFRLTSPHDIEAAAAEVRAAGGTIVEQGEFIPGEPYLFCRDPDGYDLEIWYELPTSADPAPAGA